MVTLQEVASEQESKELNLVEMAEVLIKTADKLLSAALVMAVLAEKEIQHGSLLERLVSSHEVFSKLLNPPTQSGYYQPAQAQPLPSVTTTSGGASSTNWQINASTQSPSLSSALNGILSSRFTGSGPKQYSSAQYDHKKFQDAVNKYVAQNDV